MLEHDLAINLWGTGVSELADQLRSSTNAARRVECSDAASAVGLVRHQGFVGFVVRSAVADALEEGSLVTLEPRSMRRWDVRLVLASRSKGEVDQDVVSLREALRGRAGSSRASARGVRT